MGTTAREGEALPSWRLAAFALPCVPVAAMLMPVTLYLPNYYAKDLGVGLGAIGLAFGAVRLFDLWLDPTLGFLIDKTRTRIGRYRPWLIAGLPIAVVAIWTLFMAQPGIGAGYILLWLIVGFLGQSMASMAHTAWAARLAPGYDQRARVFGWWQAFAVLGVLIVLAMPPLMRFGFSMEHADGIRAIGWFVILAMPLAIGCALLATPEPPAPENARRSAPGDYLALARRPSVLRLLVCDILIGTGPAIAGTLLFFYFEAVRGYDRAVAGLFLLVYFTAALAAVPLWSQLGRRMGKHRALALAAALYAVIQAEVLVMPHGFVWGVIGMAIAGIPFSAGAILLRAMMADIADEERLISRVDRSGLLFGLLTGAVKIGSASAVVAATGLLEQAGLRADLTDANSEPALLALGLMFGLAPALLSAGAAFLIMGHPIDRAAHEKIRAALAAQDSG
jgi:Na+/melibiose symporter-like transporter